MTRAQQTVSLGVLVSSVRLHAQPIPTPPKPFFFPLRGYQSLIASVTVWNLVDLPRILPPPHPHILQNPRRDNTGGT